MRLITVVLMTTLTAAPAFASGHGHTPTKPASEANPRAKTNDADKSFREKKSHYEKKLQATERESDQVKTTKVKGLTHAPFEAGDIADTGKEARKTDLREAPPPKLNAPAIPPPSVRGNASGGSTAGSTGAAH
jgi:hypothetical protein